MASQDDNTSSTTGVEGGSVGEVPTGVQPGETGQTGQTGEVAARPRRRRATKAAAAPVAPAGESLSGEAAPAGEDAAPESDEAAPKAPRKRATKKSASTSAAAKKGTDKKGSTKGSKKGSKTSAVGEDATDPAASSAESSAAGELPGLGEPTGQTANDERAGDVPSEDEPATPTRRRASRRSSRPTSAEHAGAAEAEQPSATPTRQVADDTAFDDQASDDQAADDEDEGEEAAPAVSTAPPGFGLLFQPPAPVAPRRRRATAPSQAPAERPAESADGSTDDAADSSDRAEPGDGHDEAQAPASAERTTQAKGDDNDATEAASTAGDGGDSADGEGGSRRRRRGGRGRSRRSGGDSAASADDTDGKDKADSSDAGSRAGGAGDDEAQDDGAGGSRRRRRRRRGAGGEGTDDPPGTVTRVREPRKERDEPTAVKGSTRLEAKKQRRREGREAGRRRTIITEAEFLARRESVERTMVVRGRGDRTQIAVLEDDVLVEHYVSRETTTSMAGNVYLGRVQNVLPSMEAAFVDIGKGRNAVLYAGEVNWDAAGLEVNQAKRIENALSSGDTVLVQVTKDPIGHKGARLTSQVSLPGRYLVYVPEGSMTGISRKLPDTERARLKSILKEIVPDSAGVIVRTAAEGASEEELRADVDRLTKTWEKIKSKVDAAAKKKSGSGGAPVLLHGEADLTVRVIRDIFTEDFGSLVVSGDQAWSEVSGYVENVAPDLADRLSHWTGDDDVFARYRVDEQIAKAMDRKVWLPSGGSLVIDRTEAMTVVDVNTGKFVGSGGNLEETVTKNNIEAAEEIVRQLRLRDIGGIIVIDFIDMVLESNRDLVVRRLLECLGRDRTKHQVAEVTSLGLVQMTRKRVGSGLIEVFGETCEHCGGRGFTIHTEPIERGESQQSQQGQGGRGGRGRRGGGPGSGDAGRSHNGNGGGAGGQGNGGSAGPGSQGSSDRSEDKPSGPTPAQIAAAAHAAAVKRMSGEAGDPVELGDAHEADTVAPAEADMVGTPEADAVGAVKADAVKADAVDVATVEREVEGAQPSGQPAQPVLAQPVDEPVVRPRRRRGRVVAPAGPPRTTEPDEPAAGSQQGQPD